MSSVVRTLGAVSFAALVGIVACDVGRVPRAFRADLGSSSAAAGGTGGQGAGGDDGGGLIDDECVGDGLCGTDLIEVVFDRPNVYFVFDRSGSMVTPEGGPAPAFSRFNRLRDASVAVVEDLGPLINVGLALFPAGGADGCAAGGEVMPVTPGDKPGASATLEAFASALDVVPDGGTPIAATLDGLRPRLAGLPGRTIVMLVTDGGPNCNAAASCDIGACQANIDGVCPDPQTNCCAPSDLDFGPRLCVDEPATVAALEAIAAAGVETYVIAIPGAESYGAVLDAMAVAGGVPQEGGATDYFRVDDLSGIEAVLRNIAAGAVSCTIPLQAPSPDPMRTNVYFDCDVVPFSASGGWTWEGENFDAITLHGVACQRLKNGEVGEVQVLTGCPIDAPR
ncbi:MAG: vWA domain-containing protein [Myxococcota bacterium]